MAKRLDQAGANGLVLFNRFYQPDIDLEALEVKPNILLSTPMAMRVPLRWIAMLYGQRARQPRRHQRHPPRHGRAEDAHGRRGRDDALLRADPPRHPRKSASSSATSSPGWKSTNTNPSRSSRAA